MLFLGSAVKKTGHLSCIAHGEKTDSAPEEALPDHLSLSVSNLFTPSLIQDALIEAYGTLTLH